MTTETRRTEIKWTLSSGAPAQITVEMRPKVRHLGTDEWTGEAITRYEGWEVRTTASAAGKDHSGIGYLSPIRNPAMEAKGYTHVIGQLAVPAAKADEALAAVSAYRASPEYQEQEARRAAQDAASNAHEAHVRRIENAL